MIPSKTDGPLISTTADPLTHPHDLMEQVIAGIRNLSTANNNNTAKAKPVPPPCSMPLLDCRVIDQKAEVPSPLHHGRPSAVWTLGVTFGDTFAVAARMPDELIRVALFSTQSATWSLASGPVCGWTEAPLCVATSARSGRFVVVDRGGNVARAFDLTMYPNDRPVVTPVGSVTTGMEGRHFASVSVSDDGTLVAFGCRPNRAALLWQPGETSALRPMDTGPLADDRTADTEHGVVAFAGDNKAAVSVAGHGFMVCPFGEPPSVVVATIPSDKTTLQRYASKGKVLQHDLDEQVMGMRVGADQRWYAWWTRHHLSARCAAGHDAFTADQAGVVDAIVTNECYAFLDAARVVHVYDWRGVPRLTNVPPGRDDDNEKNARTTTRSACQCPPCRARGRWDEASRGALFFSDDGAQLWVVDQAGEVRRSFVHRQ